VVEETAVLLRVEHLEEHRGRIAAEVLADLVHLVEHEDRVEDPEPLKLLGDAPGHGAHVSAPMAPDLRLVVEAGHGKADEFSAQGLGHGPAHRGLSRSRRAAEA